MKNLQLESLTDINRFISTIPTLKGKGIRTGLEEIRRAYCIAETAEIKSALEKAYSLLTNTYIKKYDICTSEIPNIYGEISPIGKILRWVNS
ncbi:hypothetical protein H6776_00105 [Candidatus Nomurabacteria bacterium]|nr:hypothetical protein [Candidatus Nomurabacteria bacterium]